MSGIIEDRFGRGGLSPAAPGLGTGTFTAVTELPASEEDIESLFFRFPIAHLLDCDDTGGAVGGGIGKPEGVVA